MDYRELFFKIRVVAHLHRKRLDEVVNEADLHFGQLPILATLSKLGTASQKEVAKELAKVQEEMSHHAMTSIDIPLEDDVVETKEGE